jgi:2-dehydro-3-deoxygluconokinase
VNKDLVELADVLVGNEEDYPVALGWSGEGIGSDFSKRDSEAYASMLMDVLRSYPNLKLAAVTLRRVTTASLNDWGAICCDKEGAYTAPVFKDLEIYDRVGGGDSFASGFFYGLLSGADVERAVQLGVAHGALAMTTPGDTSMVTLAEVERLVKGGAARISR